MRNNIYLILFFGLLSCKLECFLPSEDTPCISSWVYERKVINNNYSYLVCFDNKGRYEAYLLDLKTGKIEINPYNDVLNDHVYNVNCDTIFFDGRPYTFECKGQDSLIFKFVDKLYRFKKFDIEQIILPSENCARLPAHSEVGFWVQNFK